MELRQMNACILSSFSLLKKVALPVGVDGKSYWEAMILVITNDKFCSLRANFMQELFEQFQGKFYSI
jgi:hypothetical protein